MLRGCVLHSRVDHMASYGQLVGQQTYDDSSLFDRHARTAESSEAASSSSRPPALKIIVADPLKKVTFRFSLLRTRGDKSPPFKLQAGWRSGMLCQGMMSCHQHQSCHLAHLRVQ